MITILVEYPWGAPMANASVELEPLNVRDAEAASGTSGSDGLCKLDLHPIAAKVEATYRVSISHKDSRGISWKFKGQSTLAFEYPPGTVCRTGTMDRMHSKVPLRLKDEVRTNFLQSPGGLAFLEEVNELLETLRHSYPSAAACMTGKVLDDFLRLKGRAEGWWKPEWDNDDHLTLGILLGKSEVKHEVDRHFPGIYRRLLVVGTPVRNAGAHHSGYDVTMFQAMAASEIVMDLFNGWSASKA